MIMKKNGFIIRFIDIGLLVLFGFLMISDITTETPITLPGPGPDQPEFSETALVFVEIKVDGRFDLQDQEQGRRFRRIANLETLEARLRALQVAYNNRRKGVVVLIKPHPNSKTQRTIDVMDVCQRLGIPRNIYSTLSLHSHGG